MGWAGHVACTKETKNRYKILVGNPKGRRPLGRSRRIWDDDMIRDLTDESVVEICSGQGVVAGTSEHGNEHLVSIKSAECLD
jgi:hypothetical protein